MVYFIFTILYMNITRKTIDDCNANMISVDELIYLYTKYIQEDWDMNLYPASISRLKRLGFLDGEELSAMGENLVAEFVKTERKVEKPTRFEEFWLSFPKDDEHHTFSRTRAIRSNKALTKIEYEDTVVKGITEDTLIEAVKKEVTWRKTFKMSNYLKYMKSPVNWLRDSVYLDSDNFDSAEIKDEYGKELI